MSQRNNLKFGILLVAFLLPFALFAQRGEKITTVVIDPGHGGKDTGALGAISKEKDLNLTVALLTGDYIKKNFPDVKVIYTRERDVFVGLNERAMIANRNNADVFISIHCNSTDVKSSTAIGAETFVLGEHKNAANLQVAKNENSAILYEEDASEQYGDFDLNSPEAYIALSQPATCSQCAGAVLEACGPQGPWRATGGIPCVVEDGHAQHPYRIGFHQQCD